MTSLDKHAGRDCRQFAVSFLKLLLSEHVGEENKKLPDNQTKLTTSLQYRKVCFTKQRFDGRVDYPNTSRSISISVFCLSQLNT